MTRIYLARHADVENPRRVLYGHLPGFPLSERGRRQAVEMGRRLRDRLSGGAREPREEPALLVSHADPLQAAWVVIDGRAHNEREMYRKAVDRAGLLEVDVEDGRVASVSYVPPPAHSAPSDTAAA